MRCLALAQAWQEAGGRALFVMADSTPAVNERLSSAGIEVILLQGRAASGDDARQVKELALSRRARWVALDGYHFGAGYRSELRSSDIKLLWLDDGGVAEQCVADLILNQNSDATEDMYPQRESYNQLLLGTRYALLRQEFAAWREWKRVTVAPARKVLVTMGGSDPDNLTVLALQSLNEAKSKGLEVTIVAGGSNPHLESLQKAVTESSGAIRLHESVSDMPALMAQSDIAIIAGGGTLWELLYMSCPVLSFARNPVQCRILGDLQCKGVVQFLGEPRDFQAERLASAIEELATSAERRERMATLGRELIDGQGARRVCKILAQPN